jgi:hypothetical protein
MPAMGGDMGMAAGTAMPGVSEGTGMAATPATGGTDSELVLQLRDARARIAELEAELADAYALLAQLGAQPPAARSSPTAAGSSQPTPTLRIFR